MWPILVLSLLSWERRALTVKLAAHSMELKTLTSYLTAAVL